MAGKTDADAAEFRVVCAADADQVTRCAARDLANALAAMLDRPCAIAPSEDAPRAALRIAAPAEFGDRAPIEIVAPPGMNLLNAVWEYLERVGAKLPVGRPARLPRIDVERLFAASSRATAPTFARRAFAADLMTWHYEHPERFAAHLEHDREFVPWMAARGINAFSWIRHERDSRLIIDELLPAMRLRGVAPEYGGHVLQLLMPRGAYESHPDYFPLGADGARNPRGNLCASNAAAIAIVREGALAWASANPDCAMLHLWGADVHGGAWCRCAGCVALGPHRQYLAVVNAVADALAARGIAIPVAYLAYHDTLEPDPALAPRANVFVEWAPRERCYGHAIDDAACGTNRRYFDSLRKYFDLFGGRMRVFEYYADAILFGGLAIATPAVIARDLRAYHAVGVREISCLTFGAYSSLAYPLNLEIFARCARSLEYAPGAVFADVAAAFHPACATAMAAAYRALADASALLLDGGGPVMRPQTDGPGASVRAAALAAAAGRIERAIAAADAISTALASRLGAAERAVWQYSREVVQGLAEYLAAAGESAPERARRGAAAIARIADAVRHVREIDERYKGTWGAHDFEWAREKWLAAMRRNL
jgi:hypothetical protein